MEFFIKVFFNEINTRSDRPRFWTLFCTRRQHLLKCILHHTTKLWKYKIKSFAAYFVSFTFWVLKLKGKEKEKEMKRKWRVPYLEFVLCTNLTHPSAHTVNTHPEQWAANAAAPGEQLGVRCLAQGHLVVVLRVERALVIHSPHWQSLLVLRLEPATFGLQVWLSNH